MNYINILLAQIINITLSLLITEIIDIYLISSMTAALMLYVANLITFSFILRKPEPQILDFTTQQNKLFTVLADTFAIHFAGTSMWKIYFKTIAKVRSGAADQLPEVHMCFISRIRICNLHYRHWMPYLAYLYI